MFDNTDLMVRNLMGLQEMTPYVFHSFDGFNPGRKSRTLNRSHNWKDYNSIIRSVAIDFSRTSQHVVVGKYNLDKEEELGKQQLELDKHLKQTKKNSDLTRI